MLHWQLKNLKNLPWLNNLISKISNKQMATSHNSAGNLNLFIATSCVIHVCLGLFLFVFSTNHQPDLTSLQVRANAQNVKVRLVPFGSSIKGLHRGSKKIKRSNPSKKSNSRSALRTTKKLEVQTNTPSKEPLLASQKKPSTVIKSEPLKKIKLQQIKSAKKKSKKKIQKEGVLKKEFSAKTLPKPIMPHLSLIKKPEHAQVVPETTKMPTEQEKIKPEAVQPELTLNEQILNLEATQTSDQLSDSEEDILYVDYKELEALQLGGALQEAVTSAWNPPAGMGQDIECKVRITLNRDGKLIETIYEEISGVRIYDATVERALPEIKFPHQLWNKSFTLCFKS